MVECHSVLNHSKQSCIQPSAYVFLSVYVVEIEMFVIVSHKNGVVNGLILSVILMVLLLLVGSVVFFATANEQSQLNTDCYFQFFEGSLSFQRNIFGNQGEELLSICTFD